MRQRIVALAVIIAVGLAGSARAETRLAFVDLQRALNDCAAGKRAKTQLQDRVLEVQRRLRNQQTEVQSLQDELQKKGMLMSAEERQNLSDQYATKLRDFQQAYKNAQDELRQKDQEMTGAIVRDLATVVRNIGEKQGYTMVMEKGQILWGIPSIDITDEVVRAYDEMHVKAGSLADSAGSSGSQRESEASGQMNLGGDSSSFGSTISKRRSTISK